VVIVFLNEVCEKFSKKVLSDVCIGEIVMHFSNEVMKCVTNYAFYIDEEKK
jgi:hypothetical protein